MNMKVCTNPECPHGEDAQPVSEFYKDRSMRSGLTSRCKTCYAIYRKSESAKAARKRYNEGPTAKAYAAYYVESGRKEEVHRKWYAATHEERRKKQYVYNNSERGAASRRRHRQTAKWRKNHYADAEKRKKEFPERTKARQAVQGAVRHSRMVRSSTLICTECNENQAELYHHYLGYEKEHWFDVEPLCRKCHGKEHTKYPIASSLA